MSSFNKVMIMGNITRDIELRYTPKGTAVTDLGVACNRRVKQGEEWVDETTFVDVTLWGRQAELASQYLGKGRGVFIEGRLQMDSWVDQQSGQKRQRLKVVGENMQFVGGGGAGGGGGQRPPQQGAPQQANQAPAQQSYQAPPQQQGGSPSNPMPQFEDEDDDIPF
ncbi:single-stranded DNA-binding protein [Rubritalea tangerina]|uniref:Single-stranded DNA-binding protein n=1 Tax=Rubritalea tangerina TaxID=430798 RepID=A0ABW4ZB36_9BACT